MKEMDMGVEAGMLKDPVQLRYKESKAYYTPRTVAPWKDFKSPKGIFHPDIPVRYFSSDERLKRLPKGRGRPGGRLTTMKHPKRPRGDGVEVPDLALSRGGIFSHEKVERDSVHGIRGKSRGAAGIRATRSTFACENIPYSNGNKVKNQMTLKPRFASLRFAALLV
ncbi:unnamed protein product [Chrysodeixis includens]|uniref:Uncharacterized protein n=1 Tax=Chrysodeixis includens TaxID=689277 RepID=A0A9N8L5U0_CHRIL|nr:unnamed protein product [Chrysodeixis includens]